MGCKRRLHQRGQEKIPSQPCGSLRTIVFIGLVSFFTDISTEMVYPLIPLYLASTFGATPALIGLIEGIAESLASLLKVFSGYLSDRFQKKKLLAFVGYLTGIFYKLVLLFAGSWAAILGARVLDRFGKGIRTAPRDALVSENAGKQAMGRAFGLHKALDMAGAALGILAAWLLLSNTQDFNYHSLFALSIIPAVLGLGMFLFIAEKKVKHREPSRIAFWRNIKELNGQLKLYLLVVALFTLGNSSNVFLLLKAEAVGFKSAEIILLYFVYTITTALLSFPSGRLSDRVGRKRLLVAGYALFAAVYLGFGLAVDAVAVIFLFVMYGVHSALITGVERALVAEIAPSELKGTMLGLHSTVAGIALLPASVIAGLLWTTFGSAAPFIFGAVLSLAAASLLGVLMRGDRTL